MSNKRNPLEESLFHEYSDIQSKVDPHVWNNISMALDDHNKKRPLYFWAFLTVTLIISLSLLIWSIASKSSTPNSLPSSQEQLKPKAVSNPTNHTALNKFEILESDANAASSDNVQSFSDIHKVGIHTIPKNSKLSIAHKNVLKNNQSDLSLSISNQNSSPLSDSKNNNQLSTSTFHNATQLVDEIQLPEHSMKKKEMYTSPDIASKSWINTLSDQDAAIYQPTIYHPRRVNAFVNLITGMGLPIKKIQHHPSESGLYRSQTNFETPILVNSLQADLGIILDKTWSASIGIEYQQLIEKFEYRKDDAAMITYTFDPKTSKKIDSMVVRGVMLVNSNNRFNLIHIPINLGFEKRINRWILGVDAGIAVNLMMNSQGKLVRNDQDIISFSDDNHIYNKTVGTSILVGVKAIYPLNKNVSLLIRPQFQHFNDAWTLSSHPNSIHYQFVNCQVGLRWMI
jgi:hypothetical protein